MPFTGASFFGINPAAGPSTAGSPYAARGAAAGPPASSRAPPAHEHKPSPPRAAALAPSPSRPATTPPSTAGRRGRTGRGCCGPRARRRYRYTPVLAITATVTLLIGLIVFSATAVPAGLVAKELVAAVDGPQARLTWLVGVYLTTVAVTVGAAGLAAGLGAVAAGARARQRAARDAGAGPEAAAGAAWPPPPPAWWAGRGRRKDGDGGNSVPPLPPSDRAYAILYWLAAIAAGAAWVLAAWMVLLFAAHVSAAMAMSSVVRGTGQAIQSLEAAVAATNQTLATARTAGSALAGLTAGLSAQARQAATSFKQSLPPSASALADAVRSAATHHKAGGGEGGDQLPGPPAPPDPAAAGAADGAADASRRPKSGLAAGLSSAIKDLVGREEDAAAEEQAAAGEAAKGEDEPVIVPPREAAAADAEGSEAAEAAPAPPPPSAAKAATKAPAAAKAASPAKAAAATPAKAAATTPAPPGGRRALHAAGDAAAAGDAPSAPTTTTDGAAAAPAPASTSIFPRFDPSAAANGMLSIINALQPTQQDMLTAAAGAQRVAESARRVVGGGSGSDASDSSDGTVCPSIVCLDVRLFAFLKSDACICTAEDLHKVRALAADVGKRVQGSLVGVVMMYVGATALLARLAADAARVAVDRGVVWGGLHAVHAARRAAARGGGGGRVSVTARSPSAHAPSAPPAEVQHPTLAAPQKGAWLPGL